MQAKFLVEKVILNRMNFEWNKSDFSRNFKHAKDATTFLEVHHLLDSFGSLILRLWMLWRLKWQRILCTSVKGVEDFKIDFALQYQYEVHGGSHSYAARLKLLAIHPGDEHFLYALSDVYVALTDAKCQRTFSL